MTTLKAIEKRVRRDNLTDWSSLPDRGEGAFFQAMADRKWLVQELHNALAERDWFKEEARVRAKLLKGGEETCK